MVERPSSPCPFDAAVGLPARADAMAKSTESEVLHMVNTDCARYGPFALYYTAHSLALDILRRTGHAFAAYVMGNPGLRMRAAVYRFLSAIVGGDLHGKHRDASFEVFSGLWASAGEYAGRTLVCSLLTITKAVRRGIGRPLAPGA